MDIYSGPLKVSLTGLQLTGMIVEKQLRLMQVIGQATYESQLRFMGVAFGVPGLNPQRTRPAAPAPAAKAKPAAKAASKPAAKRKPAAKKAAPKAPAKPAAKAAPKRAKPATRPAAAAPKAPAKATEATQATAPAKAPAKAPVTQAEAPKPAPAPAAQPAAKPAESNVTAFPKPEAAGQAKDSGAKRPRQPSAPPSMPERSTAGSDGGS